MFISKPGEYDACGIYTLGHLIFVIITLTCVCLALKKTINKNKEQISNIIKKCTIFLWIFEIIIIIFKLHIGGFKSVNNYVPLYYCSILLYAGAFSIIGKGFLKRVGDVFIATGGIVGGLVYIVFPTTSIVNYPMFHLVSIHSFTFHGIMIYLGLLVNLTNYIKLEKKDFIYYAGLVGIVCLLAYIINNICDSNLMFISKNFPGMPLEIVYNNTGKLFTAVMTITQMTIPFYIVYFTRYIAKKMSIRKSDNNDLQNIL